MTGSRIVRLSTLVAAAATLVLGTPSSASAQCAAPTYHGGLPLWIGTCPETVAGGASAAVWVLIVLTAGLWAARALARSDSGGTTDLQLIDRVFDQEEPPNTEDER
ncbi:hypothetical protein ABZ896_28015 [Streptomyces sp. NPDC047072]|uniref:hypothetical protein n=1 Tax=Streptomyces sp. NPDC047072 TaxID=3154809 RepID=UPI0033E316AB